jgi:hypothetical protein
VTRRQIGDDRSPNGSPNPLEELADLFEGKQALMGQCRAHPTGEVVFCKRRNGALVDLPLVPREVTRVGNVQAAQRPKTAAPIRSVQ